MANGEVGVGSGSPELKYLWVVRFLESLFFTWALKPYGLFKDLLGPLKPLAQVVETAAKTVFLPFYRITRAITDAILLFFDNWIDSVVQVFSKFIPAPVKQIFQNVARFCIKFVHEARDKGLGPAISSAIALIWQFLVSHFMGMFLSFLKIPGIGNLFQQILPSATLLLKNYSQGVNKLMGQLTGLMDKGASTFGSLPIIGGLSKAAAGAASSAQHTISGALDKSLNALNNVPLPGDAARGAASKAKEAASKAKEAASGALDAGKDAASKAKEAASGALDAGKDAASKAKEAASGALDAGKDAASKATGALSGIVDAGAGAASKATGGILDAGTGAASKATGALSGIVDAGANAASKATGGILDAGTGAASKATGAVSGAVDNLNPFKRH